MKNCILILCVLVSISAVAQRRSRNLNESPEVVEPPRTGHAIGGVMSSTNGNGLAYRYWPGRLGAHVACFPIVSGGEGFLSVGSSLYYTLRDYRNSSKLFLHVGIDYVRRDYEGNYLNGREDYVSDSFNVGFGPGFETHTRYGSFSGYFGFGSYQKLYSDYYPDRYVFTLTGGISYFFEI